MSTTANSYSDPIEPTIRALGQLSPSSQGAVAALVRQLAERESISIILTNAPGTYSLGVIVSTVIMSDMLLYYW